MKTLALVWWIAMALLVAALAAIAYFALPLQWGEPSLKLLISVGLVGASAIGVRWIAQARASQRMGEHLVEGLLVGQTWAFRVVKATILVLGLAFLGIALAQPQYGSRTRILRQRGVDVVVALDFSKSMLARDVSPSRIERAKVELTRLFSELGGDRVGLVAFAGETMQFPLTIDYSALELFLRDVGPYDMPVGGTSIGRALIASQQLLERANHSSRAEEEAEVRERPSQVVILITDGEDHEGDPITAANELANAGIQVLTVGIGSSSGEPIPTYSPDGTWTGYMRDDAGEIVQTAMTEEGERQLQAIAERTHGRYFRAREGDVGVTQIREHLRALRQGQTDGRRVTVHEPRYALVLLPAFLLLLLEGLLPTAWVTRRRRKRAPLAVEGAETAKLRVRKKENTR